MLFIWLKWAFYIIGGWTAASVTAGLGSGLLRMYARQRLQKAEQRMRTVPDRRPLPRTMRLIAVPPGAPQSERHRDVPSPPRAHGHDDAAPISPHIQDVHQSPSQ